MNLSKYIQLVILSLISFIEAKQNHSLDYTTVMIGGEEVTCKYIAFEAPLRSHFVTGFDIEGNIEDYPQWVQYRKFYQLYGYNYQKNTFPRYFIASNITNEEYNNYYNKEMSTSIRRAIQKRKEAFYARPENEQYKQLKGLFFYKKGDKELVLLQEDYDWAAGSQTGWAVIENKEWKNYGFEGYEFARDYMYSVASLFKNTTIHEAIIPLLEAKGKGLLRLEGNPLHFDLVTNTMMKQQPLAIINQFIDDVQTKVASLMNKEQPQSSNKVAHAQEATTSDIKPTFPWLWMVILILTFIVLVVLIRFKLKK